jgi:hypothetical protein
MRNLLTSLILLSSLVSNTALSQTAADSFLKAKCDAKQDMDAESIISLYSSGPLPLKTIKQNLKCLKTAFKKTSNFSLFCKLNEYLKVNSRVCAIFQSYKIHPSSPDAIIDLTITSRKTKKYQRIMRVISEELTMKRLPKLGIKSRSDLKPQYYSNVEYFDGAAQLYLDANTSYEIFDHITGKKFELEEDTFLEKREFNLTSNSSAKQSPKSLREFIFVNKWYFLGGLLATSALITAVANQETPVNKVTSSESD